MKLYGIISLVLFATNVFSDSIYKWTDSNGTVHFSDIPHSGAKEIVVPGNSPQTPAQVPVAHETTAPLEEVSADEKSEAYTAINISSPINEATVRNNQGYIPVLVEINPQLKAGDLVQLLFDGNPLGKAQANLIFSLHDVNRGSHTIAAQIVDAEGNVLKASEVITVFMQRPTVGMVPNTRPNKNTP